MEQDPATGELRCIRLRDAYKAAGLALSALSKVEPYARYPFGNLVRTVMGQINRGHYVLTLEGQVVVGYAGWVLCAPEVAEARVAGRAVPPYEQCVDSPNPVLVTFLARHRAATFRQIRRMRELYPGRRVYFRRDYAGRSRDGRVLNLGRAGGP